jgi:hypothetical protein
MVCQQLDHLEWDFIQARAGSQGTDSLGWTDREFLSQAGGIKANAALGIKYDSGVLEDS